jgi:LPXTG-site transpeptidase (sortase) family protein
MKILNSKKFWNLFSALFKAVGILLILYLLVSPFIPSLFYDFDKSANIQKEEKYRDPSFIANKTLSELEKLPKNGLLTGNRIIIAKIGVNAPIIESNNEAYGLNKGAWRMPDSSTPDKNGNTIITGHRFKYLPPNNLTFYLLDKLENGDIITIVWDKNIYYYKVKEKKIVNDDNLTILKQTKDNILTLFTCDPIFSQKHRLVIISDIYGKNPYINNN